MFFAFIDIVWMIFQVLVGYNLVLPLVLLFIYILFGNKKKIPVRAGVAETDYGIIVTAYEQTHTLPPVVASLLKLNYSNYLIYIVADNCDISNLHFNDERVILLRPETVLASNTRSHFYAIRHFKRNHTHLTIIDSDNLVDPSYLNEMDLYFGAGYQAVQGERKAKNLDTTYACLDAARDLYYHFYDGKILFGIGSSATLAGSGMAFTVGLYQECLGHLDITGAGFDKVLQKEIVSRGYRIAFAPEAIVYDEKTTKSEQLVNQRARWINTWFRYVKFGVQLAVKGIATLNWNRFVFGIVLLRPPLFIFIILSFVCMMIDLLFGLPGVSTWAGGLLLFIAGFAIALGLSNPDSRITSSLWAMPKFIFLQVMSLLKVAKANQHSVATKHVADINDLPIK
jgi:cellulose synthase/poly-beta-1,6-N-acetylglucosamine synthase-like glycosyltransferase